MYWVQWRGDTKNSASWWIVPTLYKPCITLYHIMYRIEINGHNSSVHQTLKKKKKKKNVLTEM